MKNEDEYDHVDPRSDVATVRFSAIAESVRHLARVSPLPKLRPEGPAHVPILGAKEASRIGRYQVLRAVGHGGIGEVYMAYDEPLDRKVAIKVLLEEKSADGDDRLRLRREAKALARLSHPNVVSVHEVGEHEGTLFIAMEFVRGQSLSAWLSGRPRWPLVLEVFAKAGEGLAAAHRAGLVHRDFKPANVMRGEDGVVKVLDFGLVGTTNELEPEPETEPGSDDGALLSASLTVPGTVMGTPSYMSLEQHLQDPFDARSDQYSFCVSVWEGLTGARPFVARSIQGLVDAKEDGPPPWPSNAPPVPRKIIDALQRGMAPDPEDRWPTMEPLLEVLAWDPARRRFKMYAGVAVASVVGLAGTTTYLASERETKCTGARDHLAGIWDDARRTEVEGAILGIETPYAKGVWARTEETLDAFADRWEAAHIDACEATAVRGEQSNHILDVRMACLHHAAISLRTTVDTLAMADETMMSRAHVLTSRLPPLRPCADPQVLLRWQEPPRPEDAPAVEAARIELSSSASLERVGRYERAREAVDAAQRLLAGTEYGPVRTELALRRGLIRERIGDYDGAEASLVEALSSAQRWSQRPEAGKAAIGLLHIVGYQQRKVEGLRYWPIAKGATDGDPRRMLDARSSHALALSALGRYEEAEAEYRAALALEAEFLGEDETPFLGTHANFAMLLAKRGKLEEAENEMRAVVEIALQTLGPEHPRSANALTNLANLLARQGKYVEAEAVARRALELTVRAMGEQHPDVAIARGSLGVTFIGQGKSAEAEVVLREALSLATEVLGAEHADVTRSRINLGQALQMQHRYEEAEEELRLALSQLEKRLGPTHPRIAIGRMALGAVFQAQGKYREAERLLRSALQIGIQSLGPHHSSVADVQSSLATTLRSVGRYEEAEGLLREALSSSLEGLDDEHPQLASIRTELALVLLELGRAPESLAFAEAAQMRRKRQDIPAEERAQTLFVLARAEWEVKPLAYQRVGARNLAEMALEIFREERASERVAEVERWLASHPSP